MSSPSAWHALPELRRRCVYYCHIVAHQDLGMMAVVDVKSHL